VGGGDLAEDVGGHRPVDVEVGLEVARRGRDPRPQGDGVDERDPAGRGALEKVSAQDGRAADVVADERRSLELPDADELGEHLAVHPDRHVLVLVALGLAETEQVEDIHSKPFGQHRSNVAPQH